MGLLRHIVGLAINNMPTHAGLFNHIILIFLSTSWGSVSVYPLFGQTYGQGETSAAALMVGTLCAFVTLSLLLWTLTLLGLLPL